MHRVSTAERLKFLEVLAAESGKPLGGYEVQHFGRLMMRHARTYGRYCLQATDGPPMTAKDCEKQDQAEARVVTCTFKLGLHVYFDGDPRGMTIKLATPVTGKYNTLGGAKNGWGVPTS